MPLGKTQKRKNEPKSEALIPPRDVGLLTSFAADVIKAQGDGQKIREAVIRNLEAFRAGRKGSERKEKEVL